MASSIKDVATHAGISIATVSRAVNTPERVSPETLARVQAAMEALQYRPNALGRQLRAVRTGLVGVVLPSLANPVFAECMQGIDEAASAAGQRVMLMTTAYDREREARAIETMLQQRVDGLVLTVADAAANPHLDRLDTECVPYVLAYNDTQGQSRMPVRCSVTVDNRAAARDAIRALLALGHRQVRMLTGTLSASDRAALRHAGYRDALQAAGIVPQPPVEIDFNAEAMAPTELGFYAGTGRAGGRAGRAGQPVHGPRRSHLPDKFRFQAHGTQAIDLAIDVVIAVHQPDILDLGAHLDHTGRALQLQVLDDRDGIPILQDIAGRIAIHPAGDFGRSGGLRRPFMRALRADIDAPVLVRELGMAFRARRQCAHG